jgi:hypothetical protein
MTSVLEETDIISQEDLRNNLFKAWEELYMATDSLRLKKGVWERTKNEFETAQNDLRALESNRRTEILTRISGLNPANT